MARIANEELTRLKTKVSLLSLIESQGYQPQKQGKDYAIRCPFHEDDTASLIISPAKNLFNCFGCGASGSVIDWTMKTQGVSFRYAVEILQQDLIPFTAPAHPAPAALAHPCASAAEGKRVKRSRSTKLDTPFELKSDDQVLLNEIIDYYHTCLKQSTDALAYLDKRGISDEAIDQFKLGYANRSLGYRLPAKTVKNGHAIRTQLQGIGILRESGHEHFNGSLVVPVIDAQGNVQEVYGRKIGERLRNGTPKHLYLPGPHQGVFNLAAFADTEEIILCESLIDALTFWSHDFRQVTTSYGTQGFTDELLQVLMQHKIKRVLIAYDRDEAGNRAAEALAQKLNQSHIDCYRVLFPKGMDANSYACTMQPPRKSLELVIRKAEWMGVGEPPDDGSNHPPATDVPEAEAVALPATPAPESKPIDVDADIQAHEINIPLGPRHYRIRGLQKNLSYEQLKINLLVSQNEQLHIDTLDLYQAKQRASYIQQSSIELGVTADVIKADLGKVLLKLESLQDQHIQQTLKSRTDQVTISSEEQQSALDLLQSPDLLSRILSDFETCGIVGEQTNSLTGYLACVSRKLEKPLAIIVQSTSAAGKSSLMDAVLNLMPKEEKVQYAAMTGQSLYYMGETDLKHKILAIAEEEGASNASYALKLLQSEGELTIASTGKDDSSGNLVTKEYRVEGPVMLFLTTTAIDIDEELMNRCLVLTVNEDRDQTKAIHQQQRKKRTLAGLLLKQQKQATLTIHQNAQRLLRPLAVVNPYAEQLTFLDDKTRTRRDHEKYLTLIESIALLHQYQREIKTIEHCGESLEYIEVVISDIEMANQLAHELLGRTLDELPPQTRRLVKLIQHWVQQQCQAEQIKPDAIRFSRRQLREVTQWGDTALKVHLSRLVDLEYLLIHRNGQAYHYELLYQGQADDQPFLNGLIDTNNLTYDVRRSGQNDSRSGTGQPSVRQSSVVGQANQKPKNKSNNNHLGNGVGSRIENNTSSLEIHAS